MGLDSDYEDYIHSNPQKSKKIKVMGLFIFTILCAQVNKLLGMWSDRRGAGATVEAMVTVLKKDEAFTAILQKIEKPL